MTPLSLEEQIARVSKKAAKKLDQLYGKPLSASAQEIVSKSILALLPAPVAAEDVVERAAKIIQRGTEPGLHPKEAATQIAIMLDEASLLRAPEAGLTHEKVHDETVKICAAMVEPDGPPHCDCAKYSDGMWEYHCTCGNFDDCARVSNWCSDMNTSERMRSLKWNP